ncbi:MAG: hypothetical protein MUC56_00665 [Thermoanaerobaculales bacterium]|jgi:hypothetical protein|nr:hypothetical protein [Thermoanaerobaculales bacterium]
MGTHTRAWVVVGAALAVLVAAAPAAAQRDFEPLFDKYNVRLEGSWVDLATEIRLDSELLGRGTTLSFEDDLNLGDQEVVPTLAFDWQIARRHKLGVRWQDIDRSSNAQALEEIQWGDEVIPIDADISLGFDIAQYFVDYTYYPWVKDRWAAGFGIGFRVMEIAATLTWEGQNIQEGGSTDVEGTGPLPYLYFEYRRLLSDHWRFKGGLGWLQVKIEDIDGGQWVARADIEYLLGRHWGFGGAINIATIDVDWAGIDTSEGASVLDAAIDMDVNDVSLFVRFRF